MIKARLATISEYCQVSSIILVVVVVVVVASMLIADLAVAS